MSETQYSYLDFCVLPQLRGLVLSSVPVIVFDLGMNSVLWANAAGADFFGGDGIEKLLEAKPSPSQPFIRQLRDASSQLVKHETLCRGFRVVRGFRSELVQCELQHMALPNGSQTVLLTCRDDKLARPHKEHEIAHSVIQSLQGFAHAASITDDFGLVIAASEKFSSIDLPMEELNRLIGELLGEDDRLVKRPIQALDGTMYAAGIARLGQNPGRNLLVLATTDAEPETGPEFDENNTATFHEHLSADLASTELASAEDVSISNEEEERPEFTRANSLLHRWDHPATPSAFSSIYRKPVSLKNNQDRNAKDIVAKTAKQPSRSADEKMDLPTEHSEINELVSKEQPADSNEHDHQDSVEGGSIITVEMSANDAGEDISEPSAISSDPFSYADSEQTIRFAWTIDENQIFQSVSPELAKTVGPNASDIVGRKWSDVASVFGFDEHGSIGALLTKKDTWSGKSVLWPIQGTDLQVPIDLAALPIFGADRTFGGFRGFGIVRTADTILDVDGTGLALVDGGTVRQNEASADEALIENYDQFEKSDDDIVIRQKLDDDISVKDTGGSNIVSMVPHIRSSEGDDLSSRESKAFDEIGQKLRETADSEWQLGGIEEEHSREVNDSLEEVSADEKALERDSLATPRRPDNDERDHHEKPPIGEEIRTAILSELPFPVLIYRNGETLYANRELLQQSGYNSLEDLSEAGGVEAIFGPDIDLPDVDTQQLRTKKGPLLAVSSVLRSVPWDDDKALMLTFRQSGPSMPDSEKIALDMARVSEIQNILDTATDGIIVLDQNGIIESVNGPAEALFGINQSDVVTKKIDILFAQESLESIHDYLSAFSGTAAHGIINDGREVIGKEANGGLIPMFVTLGRMGTAKKLCAVIRDMTSWKNAEEELIKARRHAEEASDQKSDFLARVSHEIRTPLNAIIGFSDVMIEERFGPIDNERYREYLRDINRSGIHVLDLINDLLDLSKIESGKIELSFEAVDLNLIVSETVALMQPQANSDRIIIRTSLSRAVPKVVADARSVRQIIMNLVSNAIKFSRQNGQVIVSTVYENNGEVALRIRDTGVGMDAEELKKAMKPFHQIPGISDKAQQGTGLGLPLTKALVEANREIGRAHV